MRYRRRGKRAPLNGVSGAYPDGGTRRIGLTFVVLSYFAASREALVAMQQIQLLSWRRMQRTAGADTMFDLQRRMPDFKHVMQRLGRRS